MTLVGLIDVISHAAPMVFLCWYDLRLKRENMRLHVTVAQQSIQSDSQTGLEESIPEPLPVARVRYKRP